MDMAERVREALLAANHPDTIVYFATAAPSSADAAAAIGCAAAEIAKSIVFRAGDDVVLVVASGANRIDRNKVAAALGFKVKSADPVWVEARTGFAVGGVSPVGHMCATTIIIDEDLLRTGLIWAAAGSSRHVFRTTAPELIRLTRGLVADVRQD